MKVVRILAGVALGLLGLILLWFVGLVAPPEGVRRWVAAFVAVYPGAWREAEVDSIPCAPLGDLRLYYVCAAPCEEAGRIVTVKGLQAQVMADLGRVPPQPSGVARGRFNSAVAREGLRLDQNAAREMVGCYLRLEGYYPELILPEGGPEEVGKARRRGKEAMRRLAESLDHPGALARLDVAETAEGFETRFFYWHTARAGRPVLEMLFRLGRDGQLRQARVLWMQATDDTGGGSTPDRSPL